MYISHTAADSYFSRYIIFVTLHPVDLHRHMTLFDCFN